MERFARFDTVAKTPGTGRRERLEKSVSLKELHRVASEVAMPASGASPPRSAAAIAAQGRLPVWSDCSEARVFAFRSGMFAARR